MGPRQRRSLAASRMCQGGAGANWDWAIQHLSSGYEITRKRSSLKQLLVAPPPSGRRSPEIYEDCGQDYLIRYLIALASTSTSTGNLVGPAHDNTCYALPRCSPRSTSHTSPPARIVFLFTAADTHLYGDRPSQMQARPRVMTHLSFCRKRSILTCVGRCAASCCKPEISECRTNSLDWQPHLSHAMEQQFGYNTPPRRFDPLQSAS